MIALSAARQTQFNGLFAHELIAKGSTREVWSSLALPDCVIKVEDVAHAFQNILEWELWKDVRDSEAGKWLAPCRWISADGSILIMARTKPLAHSRYPDRLPCFLTDTKFQNYGLYKGRFVCHDYGNTTTSTYGATLRTRAAHWYDVP